MSEPLDVQVLNALCAHLKTPALTSPATPVAWPLTSYTPVSGITYLDVRGLLKAEPQRVTIGFTAPNLERGIFQIDAVMPNDGTGEAPGRRLAAQVATRFALGTKLTLDSVYLRINSPPQIALRPIKDGAWVRFPVSVPYLVIGGE